MSQKFKQSTPAQPKLKYLSAYSEQIHTQVAQMLEQNTLDKYLLSKYPKTHEVTNDKALRTYVMALKNQHLKKSSPLSQIKYDDKIHIINNALGLHTYVSRVQGNKLKSKHELRIGSLFKKAPEAFLAMIVVHELAHLKEKEHNKAFYKLCQSMLPDYHQLELDLRIYLTQVELIGDIYCK
jgi:predicted metal-dependent hydrolase